MLRADEDSDDSEAHNVAESGTEPTSLQRKSPQFGSKGSILPVAIHNTAGFEEPIRDSEICLSQEPFDHVARYVPHDPSAPHWHPPNVVPNSSWCRGQYVQQVAREVGGSEMQTILRAALALVCCPVMCSLHV